MEDTYKAGYDKSNEKTLKILHQQGNKNAIRI